MLGLFIEASAYSKNVFTLLLTGVENHLKLSIS